MMQPEVQMTENEGEAAVDVDEAERGADGQSGRSARRLDVAEPEVARLHGLLLVLGWPELRELEGCFGCGERWHGLQFLDEEFLDEGSAACNQCLCKWPHAADGEGGCLALCLAWNRKHCGRTVRRFTCHAADELSQLQEAS